MGWTFTRTTLTLKEFMDKEFENCSNQEFEVNILASGVKNGCYYAAIERLAKQGVIGKQKEVFCLVCPCQYRYEKSSMFGNHVGYKQMTEYSGPCYYDVPDKVWKILEDNQEFAPTEEWAVTWRQKVRAKKATPVSDKIEEGKYVWFENALEFRNCLKENTFKVIMAGRTKRFESVHYGFRCSIRRDTLKYAKYKVFSNLEDVYGYTKSLVA